jgi:hypothetical protein
MASAIYEIQLHPGGSKRSQPKFFDSGWKKGSSVGEIDMYF